MGRADHVGHKRGRWPVGVKGPKREAKKKTEVERSRKKIKF